MDPECCSDCGQGWEKILLSGRCAGCEVEYLKEHPHKIVDPTRWEFDGTITEPEDDEADER